MTAPGLAAERFFFSFLAGILLGVLYGFLRPLRPGHTVLSDGLFLVGAGAVFLWQGFSLCRGDLRLGYLAGAAAGAVAWEWGPGRPLRPVFSGFWKGCRQI